MVRIKAATLDHKMEITSWEWQSNSVEGVWVLDGGLPLVLACFLWDHYLTLWQSQTCILTVTATGPFNSITQLLASHPQLWVVVKVSQKKRNIASCASHLSFWHSITLSANYNNYSAVIKVRRNDRGNCLATFATMAEREPPELCEESANSNEHGKVRP